MRWHQRQQCWDCRCAEAQSCSYLEMKEPSTRLPGRSSPDRDIMALPLDMSLLIARLPLRAMKEMVPLQTQQGRDASGKN